MDTDGTRCTPVLITCQNCGAVINTTAEPDDIEGATYECPRCVLLIDMSGYVYENNPWNMARRWASGFNSQPVD